LIYKFVFGKHSNRIPGDLLEAGHPERGIENTLTSIKEPEKTVQLNGGNFLI